MGSSCPEMTQGLFLIAMAALLQWSFKLHPIDQDRSIRNSQSKASLAISLLSHSLGFRDLANLRNSPTLKDMYLLKKYSVTPEAFPAGAMMPAQHTDHRHSVSDSEKMVFFNYSTQLIPLPCTLHGPARVRQPEPCKSVLLEIKTRNARYAVLAPSGYR